LSTKGVHQIYSIFSAIPAQVGIFAQSGPDVDEHLDQGSTHSGLKVIPYITVGRNALSWSSRNIPGVLLVPSVVTYAPLGIL
jgi:hypothetical protein